MMSLNYTARRFLVRLMRALDPRTIFKTVAYYAVGVYERIDRHHLFLQASGLAFALIITIIPLVLIIFSLLGSFLDQPSIATQIEAFIDRMIPYGDYADYIKDLVITRVNEFTEFRTSAGFIGLFGVLFAATTLFSSLRTVLNTVYRIHSTESILLGKLRDLSLILLVIVFVLMATTILPGIHVLTELADHIPFMAELQRSFLTETMVKSTSLLLIFFSFFIVYLAVPHRRQPRRVILVSTIAAAILWYVAKEAFGFYIVHFITLRKIYGAYSLLIVVAFWIYYTAIVFIVGGEIGQLYGERRKQRLADGAPPA